MTKLKESPAEVKRAVIDTLMKKEIGGQLLLELAVLEQEMLNKNVLPRIAQINRVIDAQIKATGSTASLKAQKSIITEIIEEIEKKDTTLPRLKELLTELRAACTE